MSKPDGKHKCLACGKTWNGSQLRHNPQILGGGWSCADIFCGWTAVPIGKVDDEIKPETAREA